MHADSLIVCLICGRRITPFYLRQTHWQTTRRRFLDVCAFVHVAPPPPSPLSPPLQVLEAATHPLPLTPTESALLETFLSVITSLFVLIPLCYLAGAYAMSPVRESAARAKQQQLLR